MFQTASGQFPEVVRHAARRPRVDTLAKDEVPELDRAAAYQTEVERHPDTGSTPVVPAIFHNADLCLSMFAPCAQFATPGSPGTAPNGFCLTIQNNVRNPPGSAHLIRGKRVRATAFSAGRSVSRPGTRCRVPKKRFHTRLGGHPASHR